MQKLYLIGILNYIALNASKAKPISYRFPMKDWDAFERHNGIRHFLFNTIKALQSKNEQKTNKKKIVSK